MDELHTLIQKYQDKHGTGSLQYRELPDGRIVLNARKEQTVLSGVSINIATDFIKSIL
jgi:hypothetical protein